MNKQFFLAWLAVFVVWFAGSFVVHGVLLQADYTRLGNLFRSPQDAQPLFPIMLLAHVIMSGALVWIYSRGAEAKPWAAQGVRFGIAVALLVTVPTYMIYYVVQPMPGDVVARQIAFDGILDVVLGLVVAFMVRATERKSPA
ncbi:MAG TPA: hypothetical protein VIE63_02400 [Ramlibacter sp.]|jgi:hypothetical protein